LADNDLDDLEGDHLDDELLEEKEDISSPDALKVD
jgi:hypothetical protein